MSSYFPKLSNGVNFLSETETHPRKFLMIGTCQLMPIHGALLQLGHSADHLLWASHSHSEIPAVDSANQYDANIISFTLRHVFYQAVLDLYPDIPEQIIEIEPLWVRALSEGLIEDFFDACRRIVRSLVLRTQEVVGQRPTFFVTFLEPRRNFMGNLFPRYSLENISYFVQRLNEYIEKLIRRMPNCYLFDLNEVFSEHGRIFNQDDYTLQVAHASFIHDYEGDLNAAPTRMTALTKMSEMYNSREKLQQLTQSIAQRLVDNVKVALEPLQIKLIICDLDDTLWSGISGEKEQMTWNEIGTWPLGLAEALLIYKARGGMLAICSKNEYEPTVEKFKQAFKDGLRIEDFASVKINYESKAENIRRILSEVNILPQNALFIDDNPREVDEVKKTFPEMHILNTEPYDWRRKILFSPLTQVPAITNEARLRTQSIQAKIERDGTRSGASREEWLASLNIEQRYVVVDTPAHENYARAFELVNKTNQFNTNGERWSDDEMRHFLSSGGRIFCTFLNSAVTKSVFSRVCQRLQG
ncbi:HAD-IIIC family phosphatase [Sphingobium sp. CFD-1]|uniref:HAD-IIIC family phosphatase n=1 Tax=Sphingobium sp. CFD-1 TaxID=2878545 RepID=UPI00214CAE55|nr:HAD-IIIC family phosphatase [Sphingobium sp. CFD-1]